MPRPAATDILHVGEVSQLFVDDHVVAATERLTRRLHAVEKDPANPVLRPELPCEGTSIEYTSVLWDEAEQRFKTWYLCGDNQDARASPGMKSRFEIRSCYATSADGVNWDKPDLGLIECGGSQPSNAVDSGRWLQGVVYTGPEREPDERRRYKMLSWVTGGYQAAFSPDGIHWTDAPGNPVWPITGDVAPTIYDERARQYVSFAKVHDEYEGHRRRLVGRGTSPDFIHWSDPQLILAPDDQDEGWTLGRPGHHTEFYGLCGFPYAGMYLGVLWVFRVTGKVPGGTNYGGIHGQLVHSRDGVAWERAFSRMPLIPIGPQESFDCGYIHAAGRPLVVGDEVWIYYDGHDGDHGSYWYKEPWGSDEPRRGGALGLGRLRLDGFVSLDAGADGGTLTTRPLAVAGEELVVNTSTRGGLVKVEVLDLDGAAVAGFGRSDCVPISTDSVRHVVRWRGGRSLGALRDTPASLRFHLRDAELYSFRFAAGR